MILSGEINNVARVYRPPLLISTLDTRASWTEDIITEGDYAYITNSGENDSKIIDISNETSPSVTGIYYETYWMQDVVMVGGLPIIHVTGGIRAVDVGNPSAPQTVLSYSDSVYGRYLFYTGTYLLNSGGTKAESQGAWILEVR